MYNTVLAEDYDEAKSECLTLPSEPPPLAFNTEKRHRGTGGSLVCRVIGRSGLQGLHQRTKAPRSEHETGHEKSDLTTARQAMFESFFGCCNGILRGDVPQHRP
jgi:hypothetical protein